MKKFILKSDGDFLHFELGCIMSWSNINSKALCAFDNRAEAQEVLNEFSLENTSIVEKYFSKNFFI